MDYLVNLWLALIWITLVITFVLAYFKGSLVSSWIFLSSLQLVAHIPLLDIKLPGNSHFFLKSILNFTRLNFEALNSTLDDLESKMQDFTLISDPNSFYSSHLNAYGYHYSFARNTLFILLIGLTITVAWIISTCCCVNRGGSEGRS